MPTSAIEQVRSFNRLVTERVGALNDQYLARDRPLGEARLLWEIGRHGSDVRELRARLGLDSGYLSRLLRSLEAAGLVELEQNVADKRVRTAHLTAAGQDEWDLLDEGSNELARSFLEPLSPSRRKRLVAAMAEIELLLTVGLIEIAIADPAGPEAQFCLREYFAELDRRFDLGFDPAVDTSAELDTLRPPAGVFVVATLRGEPVGCGGLKFAGDEPADLKRMWVSPTVRGLGLGRRLLSELEGRAAAAGAWSIRLETNKNLTEAITLYRSAGYEEVDPFNDLPWAHHWFEKRLEAS
ncbi:MAG TPA: MarR family winged helix-turn-helix transcriptional regulator [Gaiellaceae bacterium]|nr:MarR family winged helix-turn-helix transcriptional regulator [Gaiellaceae bacterium]